MPHSSVLYMPLRLHRPFARQLSAGTHTSTALRGALWGLHLLVTPDMTHEKPMWKAETYLQVSGFMRWQGGASHLTASR